MITKRALGVDYGEARFGVAIADALGMLAHPYETIPVSGDVYGVCKRLLEIIKKEQIEVVVLGLPKNLDGSQGIAAQKVQAFAAEFQPLLPNNCQLVWIDERMTTAAAQKALHSSGRKTKTSRPIIDQVAAQMILQIYLDRESMKASFDEQQL